MLSVIAVLFVAIHLGSWVGAVDNGLARTPPLGWVSEMAVGQFSRRKTDLVFVSNIIE